jgi:glycosyltransferase involved in cell wall biosynthesis
MIISDEISIVIPAKEEEGSIGKVVTAANLYSNDVIVVLHSQDLKTLNAISNKATRIVYCDLPGKGVAMRAGVAAAKHRVIVFLDADGSHNPSDIPNLVAPILDGEAEHVAGSRMLGGSSELFYTFSEFIRLVGNHAITLVLNYKYKVRLTDSQNGYRAMLKETFEKLNPLAKHSTIEQELTTKSLELGVRFMEIPTHEYARRTGISKISTWKDGKKHVLFLIKTIVKPRRRVHGFTPISEDVKLKYFGDWG